MKFRRIFLLALVALPLVVRPVPAGNGEVRKLAGDKCFVESTYGDEAFLKATLALMAKSVTVCEALLGTPLPADNPIGLEVFGDLQRYQERDRELTGGMFQTNLAFTDYGSNNSHICMQPRLGDDYAAAETMNELMETLIVHEAFHACSFRQIETAKQWPSWLAEGLGEYVTVLYLDGRNTVPARKTLWYQRKLQYVQRLLNTGALPHVATLLQSDSFQSLGIGTDAGYGMAMLLTQFVAEDSKYKSGFKKFIASLSHPLKDGDSHPFRSLFLAAVENDLEQLNARFTKWVAGLECDWSIPQRHAWLDGKVYHLCSFDKGNTLLLRNELLPADDYAIEADLRIRNCGFGQADLIFGYTDTRLFKVAAGAAGWITLLKFDNDKWENLLNKILDKNVLKDETWATLRVLRKGPALEVFLNGTSVLTYTAGNEAQFSGRWGLGATDSMVEFRNLKLNDKPVPVK